MRRINGAAGGSQGTTVTTGNSGGDSGTAWDTVTINATAALTFDNTKGRGNFAYKCSTGGTAGTCFPQWTLGTGITTTVFMRCYYYFTANPGANHRIFVFANGGTQHANVQMLTTGKLRWVLGSGGTLTTMTNSVSLNQWIRLELSAVVTATGTLTMRLYNNADSDTITETSTGANASGQTSVTVAGYGISGTAVANIGPFWMDEMEFNDTGFPGPVETWRQRASGLYAPPAGLLVASQRAAVR